MFGDQFHAHMAGNGSNLGTKLLYIQVFQADDLIVGIGLIRHVIVVGSQQGHSMLFVQISSNGLHDRSTFVGVRATRKLIQHNERKTLIQMRQNLVETNDFTAKAGQAAIGVFQILGDDVHAVKNRTGSFLCKGEEAAMHQQNVQCNRLHCHTLTTHICTGNHGGTLAQSQRNGRKAVAALLQTVGDLGVGHLGKIHLIFRDDRQDSAITPSQGSLLYRQVDLCNGIHIVQHGRDKGSQLLTQHDAHLAFFMLLFYSNQHALGLQFFLLLTFRTADGFFQGTLLLTDGAQFLRIHIADIEAGHTVLFRVQQFQRFGGILQGNAIKTNSFIDLCKQRQHPLALQQEALDFEQFNGIQGAFAALFCNFADIFDAHKGMHQLIHRRGAPVTIFQHPLDVLQLAQQFGLLLPGKGLHSLDPLFTVGRTGRQLVDDILESDIILLLKTQFDHGYASCTLMTGTSTRACIRCISSSLSRLYP